MFIRIMYIVLFTVLFTLQGVARSSDYVALKLNIESRQQHFKQAYVHASLHEKDSILNQAGTYIFNVITDSIFPCWFNTPWNFNGTTQTPRKGSIACGYFVTTVLRDAGFDIPRVKWAQITSEEVIKKIAVQIKRFHNKPVDDLVSYLHKTGDGLYIVGLDCHIGFIYKKQDLIRFVHSNYYKPQSGVMAEPLKGWNPLRDSKYRVVGKLLDSAMVENWIREKPYK